ncbi:hypothetical protein [Streptomyces sp. NPDC051162]|uniref:hypothetical protein n=1 Tax=Streptomyces sp. NPDC051162 TaxID=3154747 RepID=UPI0034214BB2
MAPRSIMFRKWEVLYFPGGESITRQEEIENLNESDDRSLIDHPHMRRIVVRLMPNWPLAYFVLHWGDEVDLAKLDERVGAGLAAYGDFSGAIIGEVHGMTCMECKTKLRVVTAAPEIPLFTLEDMRLKSPHYRTHCPACGKKWNARVLEVLDF